MIALAFALAAAAPADDRAEMARLTAAAVRLARRPTLAMLLAPGDWTAAAHQQILLDAARDQLRCRTAALARQMAASERLARAGYDTNDLRPPAPGSRGETIVPGAASAYRLPAAGRLLARFGAIDDQGIRARGITLLPAEGAPLTAPGAGRVAYAGPYRGYGDVLIVEHGRGWTTLVAGGRLAGFEPGAPLVTGQPIGTARGPLLIELRHDGRPVDVLALANRIDRSAISQQALSR